MNLTSQSSLCQKLNLHYPTSCSCWVDEGSGINNVGIPPDIELGKEGEDWATVAMHRLKEEGE